MFELVPEETETSLFFAADFFTDLDIHPGQGDTENDPLANFDLVLVGDVFVSVLRSKPEDDSLKEACSEEADDV